MTKIQEQISINTEKIKSNANYNRLLSLNASIEAARAGEQSKGFSVIAEEVKKLSDATGQISDVIIDDINSN